jgi:site-specific recombinase
MDKFALSFGSMLGISSDPIQALENLPLDPGGQIERQWLQTTLAWLTSAPPEARTERLRNLVEGICGNPAAREKFQHIWTKGFAPRLYSEAGLPEATSLLKELIGRVKRRVLPQLENELDLYAALHMADLDEKDAQWVAGLGDKDIASWRELLSGSADDFLVAIRLLALRAASIGLSRSIMTVMPHEHETESPFYGLVDVAASFARSASGPYERHQLRETILQCRISAGLSHARLEEQGVSSDLVFRLDLLFAQLERIDALSRVISGQEDGRVFGSMLVRAFADERGVQSLLRNSVNRMARQIVTHTGKSGEHYIAASQSEWKGMGWGALGAGVITAFTALFKYRFAEMALAPLWIGIAHSLNYTLSFVLMQLLGWRLASKMPSMTAAALCSAMEKEDGMQSEVGLVAAITRTQAIVTIGNLLGAIPTAIIIDLLFQWGNGHPFLDRDVARHGLASLNLLASLTIPYAALTGGFLWFSGLVAGWAANWMMLNHLPEAIAHSQRFSWLFGSNAASRMGQFVKHHLSGVAGYVCLGLLMGLLPFVSVFAGIPVEVRHITLASASLAYDVSSLARSGDLRWADLCWAGGGLVATGLLNFSVSFALGLWLAVRATDLDTRGRKSMIAALWNEFRRYPTRFLWRHDSAATAEAN